MAFLTNIAQLLLVRAAPTAGIFYVLLLAIYRVYFHPLAGVPGPRICALTGLYEFWWDCIMVGLFHRRIEEMHDKYGPIVRIRPNEVHIRDSAFFEVLYNSNQNIVRDPWFYGFGKGSSSALRAFEPSLYKMRRSALNKCFSASAMDRIEPLMQEKVRKLLARLDEARETGKPIDMAVAFRAVTTDIAGAYAFPNFPGYLDEPDLGDVMQKSHTANTTLFQWMRHTPWLVPIIQRLPASISPCWHPELLHNEDSLRLRRRLAQEAENIAQRTATKSSNNHSPQTVLEALHTSPILPEHERQPARVFDDAILLIGAGVDAPSDTMSTVIIHALRNPSILAKLRAELQAVSKPATASSHRKDSIREPALSSSSSSPTAPNTPSPLPYTDLLSSRTLLDLPYLQACIKESLRHSPAVLARMPRVHLAAPLTYTNPAHHHHHHHHPSSPQRQTSYTLPPRTTTVSMSVLASLHDPTAFAPDPLAFRPERWLDDDDDAEQRARMERAFVPFGRGGKMCVGHELARREIALVLANVLRAFELELGDGVGPEDVANARDFFGPLPERGRGAVWVRVKGVARR